MTRNAVCALWARGSVPILTTGKRVRTRRLHRKGNNNHIERAVGALDAITVGLNAKCPWILPTESQESDVREPGRSYFLKAKPIFMPSKLLASEETVPMVELTDESEEPSDVKSESTLVPSKQRLSCVPLMVT